jgi:mRNA interferase RelE/StbE
VTDDPWPARYIVRFTPAAERELHRLRADDASRLRRPILSLALEPHPTGSARIAGSPYLRLRVGDLRVVYLVQEVERVVIVVRVARRSEATYRRLPR